MKASNAERPSAAEFGGARDHGWARLREERIVYGDLRVRQAAEFVAATGIADELQQLITRSTGRRRTCTVEGLLVGMVLAMRRTGGAALHLTQVTDILYWGIPESWRRRFALDDKPDDLHGFEAGYAVVRRLAHAVLTAMDPSPLPKNKRLLRTEAAHITEQADHQDLADKESRLMRISNRIIEASIAKVGDILDHHWEGSLGMDATVIATFARGTRTRGPVTSTDPDAGWYVRTGDHADPDLPSPAATTPKRIGRTRERRKSKTLFGYDVALAVARNPHRDPTPRRDGCGDPTAPPALIMGMKLGQPGHDPGANGTAVLDDILKRGHPAGYVAADAAYNNSRPEDWQLAIRALGFLPVYSYRSDQLGIGAQAHGAHLIEGTWYCPQMPEPLVNATQDLFRNNNDPAMIEPATWRHRIDARRPYALAPKGRPDPEGHQRYMCPATAGHVQCPFKHSSMGTDPRLPLIDPTPSPVGPPKICAQTSITMAPEHGAKHWQPHPYGSPEWQKLYGRLRNASEGTHGFAKDDTHESIERSQGRRIRGIAAQTFMLAFQLAHANQRKINAWLDTLPGPTGKPRRRARRRQTKPLGTWTPKGHLDDQPDTAA